MVSLPKQSLVLVVGALLLGGRAQADTNKCQQALDKQGAKFESTVVKAIGKCVKAVQAEIDAGGAVTTRSSDACESALAKLYAARAKALGKCLGLGAVDGNCSAADLYLAGHLVSQASGSAAVGSLNGVGIADIGLSTGPADFVCQWLIDNALQDGVKGVFARMPNGATRIADAAAADLSQSRTNLQTFNSEQPRCATHMCTLNAANSGAYLNSSTLGQVPLALSGAIAVDVCRPIVSGDARSVQAGTLMLAGRTAKILSPINFYNLMTVCGRILRVEGECNCGQSAPANGGLSFCRDADTTSGTNCTAVANTKTLAPAGGTDNGPILVDFNAPTLGTGACHGIVTVEIATHDGPPVGGSCTSSGPTLTKYAPASVMFTTASVFGALLDSQAGDLSASGGVTGTSGSPGVAIPCTNLQANNLSGLQLVGVYPVVDDFLGGDSMVGVGLTCQ